ncbi:MAG: nucleotidyl transferase AbiEii/AbiGii toxin family protein [Flavobacteriales bacterium]|mgnify:CR=1 FL=1|nr:nucleotidyl transferase AbiEii/AbiGii toxin family protein [Flavobacteriales bacterium]
MFWTILDEQRQKALPALGFCRSEGFYLAGGTALALQIGHRDSVDFDFFKNDAFDTALLFEHLREAFFGRSLVKVQDERNTLSVVAADSIKLSFMSYRYPLLRPVVTTEHLDLADIADIGCMKLSAITGRGTMKDYVDLYFILQCMSLQELLALCAVKLPALDRALILKALVYFDDLDGEPILYMKDHEIPFEDVKKFLMAQARKGY